MASPTQHRRGQLRPLLGGLISAEELHRVLCSMGEDVSMAACKSMMRSVDKNGDGSVNFEEFIQLMTKSTGPGPLAWDSISSLYTEKNVFSFKCVF